MVGTGVIACIVAARELAPPPARCTSAATHSTSRTCHVLPSRAAAIIINYLLRAHTPQTCPCGLSRALSSPSIISVPVIPTSPLILILVLVLVHPSFIPFLPSLLLILTFLPPPIARLLNAARFNLHPQSCLRLADPAPTSPLSTPPSPSPHTPSSIQPVVESGEP